MKKNKTKNLSPKPSFTLGEMKSLLENGKLPKGDTILLRIHHAGMGFLEMNHDLVMESFTEIVNKSAFVKAGVDEFTSTEKLLFQLLLAHCNNG